MIAIYEDYMNTETVEDVAEPNRIVKVDSTQMTSNVINSICPHETGSNFKNFD